MAQADPDAENGGPAAEARSGAERDLSRESFEWLASGEVEHRARNTLALIRSTFVRTAEAGGSLEDVEMHLLGRFDTLARYQLASANRANEGVDLECLIRDELRSFQFGDGPGIIVAGPAVRLTLDQAQPFALAIHELVTNSLKFGALATSGAALSIEWDVSDGIMRLTWLETGVPVLGPAPQRRGFGRQYIEEALPYQLEAATSFAFRAGGIMCTISLPLTLETSSSGGQSFSPDI